MKIWLPSLTASILVACAPSAPAPDAAADSAVESSIQDSSIADGSALDASIDAAVEDATAPDAQSSPDVTSPTDATNTDASCSPPDGGALQRNYYCDTSSVHVLANAGAATLVMATARLGSSASMGCGVVDSVEVVRGATMLQRVDGAQVFSVGANNSLVVSATAAPALEAACADTTGRLSAYGMIIRGRDQRGPFEARCGAAESGGRWPPGLHLACHSNLERPPLSSPGANFTVMNLGATSSTTGFVSIPHSVGAPALTMVAVTIEVLSPQRAPFSAGPPLSGGVTMGWMNRASETTVGGQPSTQLSLNALGPAPFASELCPPPAMPGPGSMQPPYFLAKISGLSARGAVTTEVLSSCTSIVR